jgi:hypothetical protein
MFVQMLSDNVDMGACHVRVGGWPGGHRRLTSVCFFLLFLALAFQPAFGVVSAPPLLGLASSSARQSVLNAAESYLGVPYRFGGSTKSGIDCSGLVYVSYLQATGIKIPRTVDTLARWSLVIPVGELEPGDLVFFDLQAKGEASSAQAPTSVSQAASFLSKADHVGIYIGDGFFIHAASSGPHTGVIQSSLNDSEWKRRLLFAGRALPTSTLSGFAFDWGAGVSFAQLETLEGGPLAFMRGLSGWGEVSFPLSKNFSAGLRAGADWDRYLGVVRVPVELDIGQISGFSVFAGPALTLGAPDMDGRLYSPGDFFIATGGLRWSPLFFSSGAQRFGTYFELRYDYYVPAEGQTEAPQTDLRSCLNFSIGIRLRTVKY